MALNGTEILILADAIGRIKGRAQVLSLSYPDLLFPPQLLREHLPQVYLQSIRIRADSKEVALNHGHEKLLEGIFDSVDFFAAMGADLHVSDFADLGHGERILDLNGPIPHEFFNSYDLIIDPGTLEHVFNIPKAMSNVTE